MSAAQQIPQIAGATTVESLQASVNDRLRRINNALGGIETSSGSTASAATYGTHAQRIGRKPPADGAFFVETDRGGVLYQAQGTQWMYVQGTMAAPFASIPRDLGKNDAGFIFFDNTNSLHVWQWSGTAWAWGPGDRHPGEMAEFDASPGVGWTLCDGSGSHVRYLPTATTITISVPDRRGFYTEGSGVYTGTGVAAHAPTIANSQPFDVSSESPGAILSVTPVNVSVAGATTSVVQSVSVNPAITHAHTVPVITLNADGTPATFATLYYYRL